jgi:ribosome-interacting GTPase 1
MVPDASKYDIDNLDHSLLMDKLLYGVISAKHKLQQCSTEHLLHDEGVVQTVAKEEEEDRG